ncbi:hypothetical protein H9Q74_009558 [Fusarium xylarioides]|nr:hypothetical protein H9Q71_009554 [Fusarium xylarioides]KAG5819280.1 hypothetical protein H9Q74_009558 [Fusarium xylarioides]
MSPSCFSSLPAQPTDEIFDLLALYRADASPDRVNLGVGVYCTDEGKSWPLDVVTRVEKQLFDEASLTRHDYLPIEGDQQFLKVARDLIFAEQDDLSIASVQTVSGTGANHIGARFVADYLRPQNIWVSDPTWANHHMIWESVGMKPRLYPYYKMSDCSLDFEGMIKTLEEQAQPRDAVLLHACAHNPTGLDPTKEQWKAIAELCQRKQLFPFFDAAYQGFASGSPAEDAWAIRYFYHQQPRPDMIVAQSFSKNFGLYGHRTGAVHLVLAEPSKEIRDNAYSTLSYLLRSEISMAPKYGSTIVKTVLDSEELTAAWMADLQVMSSRIKSMRQALYDELVRLETPGTWNHIVDQIGMFSYTGLSPFEVKVLRERFHIYLLNSGRISISGLNKRNVQYVAKAIHDVRTQGHALNGTNGTNGTNGVNGH